MKSGKKVVVAVNKLDNIKKRRKNIYNYYELGFEEVMPISGEHSLGLGDLLDKVTEDFNINYNEEEEQRR